MAAFPLTQTIDGGRPLWSAIVKLACWRFRRTWRFLFVTWLGLLATVTLICTLPLFSRVALTSDLRTVAASAPDGPNLLFQVNSLAPTASQLGQIRQQLDLALSQNNLASYIQGKPGLTIQTPALTVPTSSAVQPAALVLNGYDSAQAASHLRLLQGRLPQQTGDGSLEIALTGDLAHNLGISVGSSIQVHYPASFGSVRWTLRVVGLITPDAANDTFWSSSTSPFSAPDTSTATTAYNLLTDEAAIEARVAHIQITTGTDGATSNVFHLFWSYPVAIDRLDANNIAGISQAMSNLGWPLESTLSRIPGVAGTTPLGTLFDTLATYQTQTVVLGIVITLLLVLVLAIVLFLVSMLADLLIERQTTVIAILRSRGATRQHIFGSFALQGLVLGLLALVVGPFLALQLVQLMVHLLLSPTKQAALHVITADPLQTALDVKWYALLAILVALLVLIVAISNATRLDIVALRREAARTRRVPLWRRLNLDLLLALLILAGFIVYNTFWQTLLTTQEIDPTLYNILKVSGFIAPLLLIAAGLLLFLRVFPWMLRMVNALATRPRGAAQMLAFTQMLRNQRPAARQIVLLALTIAASSFLLSLLATQQARTVDAATFAVGADFAGPLSTADDTRSFAALKTRYSSFPGVQSATIGYYNAINLPTAPVHLSALDADTCAQTLDWTSANATQPLSQLTHQLIAHRADSTTHNVVYAIVDAAFWQQFQLSPGASFVLPVDPGTHIQFIALAEVDTLPGVYDTPLAPANGIGIIVDYTSYASVYARESGRALAPNGAWLRVHDDPTTQAKVHQAFPDLLDRQQLIDDNQESAVHLDIVGVLSIAVGAALLLSVIGMLLVSWLHAMQRGTGLVVLRALGMAPGQIAGVLIWEQVYIYLVSFLLGSSLAALLMLFVTPAVSLLDLSAPGGQSNPFDVPTVRLVIPYSQLLLMLAGLGLVGLVTLLLIVYGVSRQRSSSRLRLNED